MFQQQLLGCHLAAVLTPFFVQHFRKNRILHKINGIKMITNDNMGTDFTDSEFIQQLFMLTGPF